MTRSEEDRILQEEGTTGKRKRGRPRKALSAFPRDIRLSIPLDRQPMTKRLAYGFGLMALSEAGVYGERSE